MLAGKTLTDFKNHFLPNKVKRNDDIILKQMFKEMTERNSYKTHKERQLMSTLTSLLLTILTSH